MNYNYHILLYIKRIYLVYNLLFSCYCIVCILHFTLVPLPFSCHDSIVNCNNNNVFLHYMDTNLRNDYVKLTHLTHHNIYEHIAHPLLTASGIDTSNISLHFHCDYG